LWLRQRGAQGDQDQAEENRLDLKVYRQIIDDMPLQIVTRIALEVAGHHREVVLGPVTLDDGIPMSLESALPARLEPDGRLRVQVRPGSWILSLQTRQTGLTQQLDLALATEVWVPEEIWVFEARNELRWVEIEGVTAIDPQQTTLPAEWRQFPAYQVKAGDVFKLNEKRRGDPDPAPDQLELKRHLWLDFDGRGYSIQDRISGTMTQGWRLEMTAPAELGRVSVNGEDQFITQLQDSTNVGVEVRRGQIDLVADSRLETALTDLPAVGWEHDFQQVNTTLSLPPGWRLLEAQGADDVPNTWIKRWTLLDLFVVLIIALAVGKLWRWWWGLLALITLILVFHENEAPRWIWLNILAATALLQVLPTLNWFSRFVRLYRDLSLITLLIIVIPFMVQQMRQSLYAQLEYPWQQIGESTVWTNTSAVSISDQSIAFSLPEERVWLESEEQTVEGDYYDSISPKRARKKQAQKPLAQIDPNAQVQTGPGLPQWEWREVPINWSGPVNSDQSLKLWLISPTVNSLLGVARVGLLAMLTAFLLWVSWQGRVRVSFDKATTATLFMLTLSGFLYSSVGYSAEAMPTDEFSSPATTHIMSTGQGPIIINEFPSQKLLDELKKRLLSPPDCVPHCASSPRLRLELTSEQLQIRLEIHSHSDIAIPLPGQANQWLAQQVWVDGEPARGLWRSKTGQLWLYVNAGIHQVQLTGTVPTRQAFQLSLMPLKPRFIEMQVTGWRVEGVHENGVADNQLQFTREQTKETQPVELEMGNLPPFVQVERTLLLGLDWQVETRIKRLTPLGSAIVLEIPLLAGESVTSEKVRVNDGKAFINLAPREAEISWLSVFKKQEAIQLVASETTASREVWRADVSAIWHVEIEGIPVIHHQDQSGRWLPEWRPWPGESVTLHLSRPVGVPGQVLTIDRSHLKVSPGQRTTDSILSLNLRSSRGGQHTIALPVDAELQAVTIDEVSQPIRQEGFNVTLPINPGAHQVALTFRQPIGISQQFKTPLVGLEIDSVNTHIALEMPQDRWILLTDSSPMGPAVIIWGILIVLILIAFGLGRVSLTPLNTWQWILLLVVLSQVPIQWALIVVGWLMLLGWRAKLATETTAFKFNLIQIGLVVLTLVALSTLFYAVKQGLLGYPEMHIAGNGSSAFLLNWYEDRTTGTLPQVWVISTPVWIYRILMLLWALWLAFALLRWLKWGWQCFSDQTLWKPLNWWKKRVESKP
jgi:hypothetical protein